MTDYSFIHPHWASILSSQITLLGPGCPLRLRILRYLKDNEQVVIFFEKKKKIKKQNK